MMDCSKALFWKDRAYSVVSGDDLLGKILRKQNFGYDHKVIFVIVYKRKGVLEHIFVLLEDISVLRSRSGYVFNVNIRNGL
jgi:hypothetical protein